MIAVTAYVWALFGLVLAGSTVLIVRAVVGVLRRLKELGSATRSFTQELDAAMENINAQLERAQEGMGRIRGRRER